ncbi:hypothetical protein CYMTET_52453, partial [Cymbomonas tetramitiformis]
CMGCSYLPLMLEKLVSPQLLRSRCANFLDIEQLLTEHLFRRAVVMMQTPRAQRYILVLSAKLVPWAVAHNFLLGAAVGFGVDLMKKAGTATQMIAGLPLLFIGYTVFTSLLHVFGKVLSLLVVQPSLWLGTHSVALSEMLFVVNDTAAAAQAAQYMIMSGIMYWMLHTLTHLWKNVTKQSSVESKTAARAAHPSPPIPGTSGAALPRLWDSGKKQVPQKSTAEDVAAVVAAITAKSRKTGIATRHQQWEQRVGKQMQNADRMVAASPESKLFDPKAPIKDIKSEKRTESVSLFSGQPKLLWTTLPGDWENQ